MAKGCKQLEAEFKEKGSGSGCGIEPEGESKDGGFGDRHPCVFSIEVGLFVILNFSNASKNDRMVHSTSFTIIPNRIETSNSRFAGTA